MTFSIILDLQVLCHCAIKGPIQNIKYKPSVVRKKKLFLSSLHFYSKYGEIGACFVMLTFLLFPFFIEA